MDAAIGKLSEYEPNIVNEHAANILIVDDEPFYATLLEQTLRSCGYLNLVATNDPSSVSDLYLRHRPDLIILDLSMPKLDGFQVMNQLRELDRENLPPILVVTGEHNLEFRVRALREGAADYLTKPINADELLLRVGNLIKTQLYKSRLLSLNESLQDGIVESTRELFRSRQMIRELAAHHEKIREQERAHIAREIHDEFGQYLTALRMDTAMLNIRYGAGNPELEQHLAGMKQTIDTTIGVARNLAAALRPGALDMGLVSAAEWLLKKFEERTGTPYLLHAPREDLSLDNERATAAFRILQEALTNITRYAQASEVDVSIDISDENMVMIVRDDGTGFDPTEVRGRKTFGLLGIRERALIFGGESRIDSEPGVGTTLRIRIPLHTQEH